MVSDYFLLYFKRNCVCLKSYVDSKNAHNISTYSVTFVIYSVWQTLYFYVAELSCISMYLTSEFN